MPIFLFNRDIGFEVEYAIQDEIRLLDEFENYDEFKACYGGRVSIKLLQNHTNLKYRILFHSLSFKPSYFQASNNSRAKERDNKAVAYCSS